MLRNDDIEDDIPKDKVQERNDKPKWHDPSYDERMNGTVDPSAIGHEIFGGKPIQKQSDLIKEFMKVLSIAHSCVAETVDGKICYNGISPDDVALVEFAASIGFVCTLSDDKVVKVKTPSG